MASLKDKVVIVTGTSSGIGLATTKLLMSHGARVYGVDVSAAPADVSQSEGNFKFLQCNLTEKEGPSLVIEGCQKAFDGQIDSLLNIAGVMDLMCSVDKLVDEDWDRIMNINLTVPVKLMREVVNYWLAKGEINKSIVNVSSKAGMSGAVAGVAYTASKHGLIGATKNVAYRFKDGGIRCNAICPGAVVTNISSSVQMDKVDGESWGVMKPVLAAHFTEKGEPRGKPEHIAELLAFLVSDASAAM